jgi:predicted deacylase
MAPTVSYRTLDLAGVGVPVIDLDAAQDGPRLVVLAGVHGCEYAPMAAVRRWARELGDRELRGSVTAVPVLNLSAFRSRTPFVTPDDGKNLNRCFPGNPSGTFTERLADAAFRQLIAGADAVIDVHAGDMVEALEPFALYDAGPAEAGARELATAYGLGYVIRQEPGPDRAVGGTSSAAAATLGIPAIIAEAGGRGSTARRTRPRSHVPPALPVAALRGRGLVGARGPARGNGGRGPAARHREHARRGPGPPVHHRARAGRAHVRDQLTRGDRGRPAAGTGSRVGSVSPAARRPAPALPARPTGYRPGRRRT